MYFLLTFRPCRKSLIAEQKLLTVMVRSFFCLDRLFDDTGSAASRNQQQNRLYPSTRQHTTKKKVNMVSGINKSTAIPRPKQNSISPHILFISKRSLLFILCRSVPSHSPEAFICPLRDSKRPCRRRTVIMSYSCFNPDCHIQPQHPEPLRGFPPIQPVFRP